MPSAVYCNLLQILFFRIWRILKMKNLLFSQPRQKSSNMATCCFMQQSYLRAWWHFLLKTANNCLRVRCTMWAAWWLMTDIWSWMALGMTSHFWHAMEKSRWFLHRAKARACFFHERKICLVSCPWFHWMFESRLALEQQKRFTL